tara:strand:+ start:500 stop:1474 length:975 start_codon:yes stop_codon:yes gene_type:complete
MKKTTKSVFYKIESYFNYKYNKSLNNSLSELKKIDPSFSLKFIDVGASEDIHPRWKRISKFMNYVGFEPDKRSRDLLEVNETCKSYNIFPFALWEKSQKLNINFTKEPRVSSSYKPNIDFLNKFKNSDRFRIIKKLKVDSVDLDSLEISEIDFIKMDVQGGESNIIDGAKKSLERCIGLELEVEFLTLYNNQLLFGDIQEKLQVYGFEFVDFVNLCRWERDEFNGFGQCVFGDAIFLKSPENIIKTENLKLLTRYLSVLLLYKRFDLIDCCFLLLGNKKSEEFDRFKKSLKHIRQRFNYLKKCNRLFNGLVRLISPDNKVLTHY